MIEYVHPRDYELDDLCDGDLRTKDRVARRLAEGMDVAMFTFVAILEMCAEQEGKKR